MISHGTAVSIDLDQRNGNWRIYELTWLYGYGGTVELSGLDRSVLQTVPALTAFNFSDFFNRVDKRGKRLPAPLIKRTPAPPRQPESFSWFCLVSPSPKEDGARCISDSRLASDCRPRAYLILRSGELIAPRTEAGIRRELGTRKIPRFADTTKIRFRKLNSFL
jgi:hypothetical protein